MNRPPIACLFAVVFLAAAASLSLRAEDGALAPPSLAVDAGLVTSQAGTWSYAGMLGYVWRPDVVEAEWSPLMYEPFSYGGWAFLAGWGWVWAPTIPPWDVSPLGWGWDGWYGGWYGFLPNGNWAGIAEFRPDPYGLGLPYIPWPPPQRHRRPPTAAPVLQVTMIRPMTPPRHHGDPGAVTPHGTRTWGGASASGEGAAHRPRGGHGRPSPAPQPRAYPSGGGHARPAPAPQPRVSPPPYVPVMAPPTMMPQQSSGGHHRH